MTRDQISELMQQERELVAATTPSEAAAPGTAAATSDLGDDETSVMPEVADGVPVRWIDPAAPWLTEAGGESTGTRLVAALVARVQLRYDETKADLVHDEEYECVITPLGETVDVGAAIAVDFDHRELRTQPPDN
jgi:hypothetical protein